MAIMRESRASSEDHLPRPGALGSTAEDIGPEATRLPDRRLVEQPPELQLLYDTAPIGLAFLSRDCRYVVGSDRTEPMRTDFGARTGTH